MRRQPKPNVPRLITRARRGQTINLTADSFARAKIALSIATRIYTMPDLTLRQIADLGAAVGIRFQFTDKAVRRL